MFQLHIDTQVFSNFSDFEQDFSDLPDYARAALTFCKEWLSGEKTFVQKTSGSTGVPKKIELSREQMQASALATSAFFNTNSDTKLLCCLNPEYIAGKMMLVRAMIWDCPVWLIEPSGDSLSTILFIPDFVAMVPLQVEQSLQNPESLRTLKNIPNLIIGGAQLSGKLKRELIENEVQAWQTYGMTETVSHIALAKITDRELLYETLPNVEIGQDERGALWVKSPMSGPEKIQTNDLIEMKSKTSFYWLGRVDFVVNSGGIKLHPELLAQKAEAMIQAFFSGSRFFFFGEKDERLGEKLVLILESRENTQKSQLLLKQLATVLNQYEVPKMIYFRNKFITTDSGKVNRTLTFQSQ